METNRMGLRTLKRVNPDQANRKAGEVSQGLESSRVSVPDEIYEYSYSIFGREYSLSIKKLLELDVSELSELTLNNLRVTLEQMSSVRITLLRAREELKEIYSAWKINYQIWWSAAKEMARDIHWQNQTNLAVKFGLAKSGMKSPVEDDILAAILSNEELQVSYKALKEEEAKFEKQISTLYITDIILGGRGEDLREIIKSRYKQSG